MTLTLVIQFLKIRKNRKVICFLVILITLLIFYKLISLTTSRAENEWDPNTVRNLTENIHDHVKIPPYFCQYMTILVVLVQSRPSNFENRDAIRRTWKSDRLNFFFVVGRTTNKRVQQEVYDERRRYHDIIEVKFLDSYGNLTLKSIVMLKLATLCSQKASYFLKTRDDAFLNINKIEESLFARRFPETLLMGHLKCDAASLIRHSRSWHDDNTYSRYLSGDAYLMSLLVAQKLYQRALETPPLDFEDVFITGVCAKKAELQLEHNEFFTNKYVLGDPCLLRRAYAVFKLTPQAMKIFNGLLKSEHFLEDCKTVFSSVEFFFDMAFPFKVTPFSYRKTCK